MALTPQEAEARQRLLSYNNEDYHPDTNPYGQAGEGYLTNFTAEGRDIATYGQAIERETQSAISSAADAEDSAEKSASEATKSIAARQGSEAARDQAETFKNQAAASAASTQFPVAGTTGTSTAYAATITGFVLTDGASLRLNLHVANGNAPTFALNTTGAKPMVAPDGRALVGGELVGSETAVLVYEQSSDKWLVINLPRAKWAFDNNANGKRLVNLRDKQRSISYRGPVAPQVGIEVMDFWKVTRIHGFSVRLRTGTASIKLYKNGTAISFGSSTTLAVGTATQTYNATVDFAVGDRLTMDITSASGESMTGMFDTTEDYSA